MAKTTTPSAASAAPAEVWDPATSTFSPAGSPVIWVRHYPTTTTTLPDGRVLIAAGCPQSICDSVEVWDPATASFSPTGSLAEPRSWHSAMLLPDGRVLVVGGWRDEEDTEDLASAEVWDPVTDTVSRQPDHHPTTLHAQRREPDHSGRHKYRPINGLVN